MRLIVALDFDNEYSALMLVDQLDPMLCALKVGLEMFTLLGPNFIRLLRSRGFKVFLDLKFHDIPNTVARACQSAAELGVWMLNLHASGGLSMMQHAKKALEAFGPSRPLLIAVTVLTSMSQKDLATIGVEMPLEQYVTELALSTKEAGLDGVVSSALEVAAIKAACGSEFLTVTPGIRMPSDNKDDQTRTMTPAQAITAGSDYLVVGRPITRALNPADVVRTLLLTLKT